MDFIFQEKIMKKPVKIIIYILCAAAFIAFGFFGASVYDIIQKQNEIPLLTTPTRAPSPTPVPTNEPIVATLTPVPTIAEETPAVSPAPEGTTYSELELMQAPSLSSVASIASSGKLPTFLSLQEFAGLLLSCGYTDLFQAQNNISDTETISTFKGETVVYDDNYIYTAAGGNKVFISAVGEKQLYNTAVISLGVNDVITSIFLRDNRLAVIGITAYEKNPTKKYTFVSIYDLATPQEPILIRNCTFEGLPQNCGISGAKIFIVSKAPVSPVSRFSDSSLDLNSLLPTYYDSASSDSLKSVDITKIKYFPERIDKSYTMIATVDFASVSDAESVPLYLDVILGSPDSASFSESNLYISRAIWNSGIAQTNIFRFRLNVSGVEFSTVGTVNGLPMSTSSLNEYNSLIRIATSNSNKGMYLYVLDFNMGVVSQISPSLLDSNARVFFNGDTAFISSSADNLMVDFTDVSAPKITDISYISDIPDMLYFSQSGLALGLSRNYQTTFIKDYDGSDIAVGVRDSGLAIEIFEQKNLISSLIDGTFSPASIILRGQNTVSPAISDTSIIAEHTVADSPYTYFAIPLTYEPEGKRPESIADISGFTGVLLFRYDAHLHQIELLAALTAGTTGSYSTDSKICFIDDLICFVQNGSIACYSFSDFAHCFDIILA
ncbi:MAG: hypothetical protein E7491_03780 [Ruminococcaceae bacterium]|nr:hypothetical protein [Oscillospiraceae bacterium]